MSAWPSSAESPPPGYRQGTSCIFPGWRAEGGSKFSVTLCCGCSLVAKSYATLCDPMDCSLPASSVHGISQARILKWVAISFSRGIYPTQGLNLGSPALQANSLPLSQLGSLTIAILKLIGSTTVCYNDVHGLTNAGIYYESYFKMFVLCYQ